MTIHFYVTHLEKNQRCEWANWVAPRPRLNQDIKKVNHRNLSMCLSDKQCEISDNSF